MDEVSHSGLLGITLLLFFPCCFYFSSHKLLTVRNSLYGQTKIYNLGNDLLLCLFMCGIPLSKCMFRVFLYVEHPVFGKSVNIITVCQFNLIYLWAYSQIVMNYWQEHYFQFPLHIQLHFAVLSAGSVLKQFPQILLL